LLLPGSASLRDLLVDASERVERAGNPRPRARRGPVLSVAKLCVLGKKLQP
ncbi:unnamed protein product, partial [Durusdinium trenchii]